ncbi:MAG: glycosyltransferase family 2 protein [Candidatus Liptonbacteria bacterium]|nr:glycosyltransferase family 2 protein [Candidatus Liptonbacteria bacterium]
MSKPFLSIIIPAYNEEERLPLTLVDMDKRLSRVKYSYEILVVNDGSTDNTAGVVEKMSPAIKNLKLIDNRTNQGKGGVVKQGMLLAKGEYRLFTDADNSTSIDHFDKMLPYLQGGNGNEKFDVVIGSRAVKGSRLDPPQPFYRQLLGKLSNLIIQAVNVPGIWDTQCGFKVFTEESAERIFGASKVNGWGFDIEALALARHFGYRIKEMPVHWVNNAESRVKFSAYLKTFAENVKIRWWIIMDAYNGQIANSK